MITTKLVPPRYRRKLVERRRLINRLNEGAYRSLIFVKAASGFGKTALLTQWRQDLIAQGCRVGWFNLDASDNEESQFLAYWMAALQQAGCDFGQGALAVYRRGEPNAIASFVTALINDLSALEDEIYLVLEDCHCITNASIHALLERVLDYAPTNFHLVISSRTEPPFSLHQLRVHDRVAELGLKALKFNHDETHALLTERLSREVEPERSRALLDAAEGWVAGIQMLTESWQTDGDAHAASNGRTPARTQLSESILQSTFERLPAETVDLLLRLSIFDRFTPALCEDVIGVSHADDILEKLSSDGVLLVPLDHDEHWYRFHPLFTEYLRRRLVLRVVDSLGQLYGKARACLEQNDPLYSPQFSAFLRECRDTFAAVDLPAMHLKASAWFERRGDLVDAVRHALSAGENETAYDLIERCAMAAIEEGDQNTVLAWVANMPAAELAKRWHLRLANFWALVGNNDLQASSAELNVLAAGVSVPGGITQFEFAVCEGVLACLSERSGAVLELKALWPPSGDAFHNQAACNILIYAYANDGLYEKARDIQAWVEENLKQTKLGLTFAYNRGFYGWTSVIQGNLAASEQILSEAVSTLDAMYGRRSTPACVAAGYLAEVLYESNSLSELGDLLAGRLDVMNQLVFFESLVRAYLMGARLRFIQGEIGAAYDLLDRLKIYGASKGLMRPVAAALGERIRMMLLQRDTATALGLQKRLEEVANPYGDATQWETLGNAMEIPLTARLSRVRCEIALGNTVSALQLLNSLATASVIARRFDIVVRVRLLRSLALANQKETAKATQALYEVLRMTAHAGVVRIFIDEGKSCETLLKLAGASLPSTEPGVEELRAHIQTILTAFAPCQPQPREAVLLRGGASAEYGTERLSAREKEVLQLLACGMPNKRIAATMNVSVDTVKWHLKNIFEKLDVADRLQAIDKARRTGIIHTNENVPAFLGRH